jgi:AraC family transcriptional regulator
MSDTTYSTGTFDHDTTCKLLDAASAILDTDRDAAKACIQRAAELLRSSSVQGNKRAKGSSAARGGLALWQKQRIEEYVGANLASCIRATDLARVVRLSTGHFFRAFREAFGEPPLAYVMKQRMRRCQELMSNSTAPLSEIALDCGMSDQSHLTRVFRRVVGVNPGVWRRQLAQQTENEDGAGGVSRNPAHRGGQDEYRSR